MKKDKEDQYVVADMSSVGRPALFRVRLPHDKEDGVMKPHRSDPSGEDEGEEADPYAGQPWRQEEKVPKDQARWYAFGALKAGLLIWLAFAGGLGLLILLMVILF